jgi:hypothetical protein
LGLVIVFCVVFFALSVILWAGTLGFQGLIYSEPASGLPWRGPAAAAVLTALFAVWCYLSFSNFDPRTETQLPFDTIFRFQPNKITQVDKLYAVKNGQETPFTKRNTGGKVGAAEFRDGQGNPWRRSDTTGITEAIIVEENGQRVTFVPKLASDGKTFPPTAEAFPGYYEQGGRRVMVQLGQVSLFQWGVWFFNIVLNVAHFGLWFLCLWLVLRFQWPHALGLAVVAWAIVTLVLLPMLLDRTRDVAKERANPAPRAARMEMRLVQPEWRMCMMSPSLTT